MADSFIKTAQEIALATDGVSGITFPGVLPIPTEKGINLEVHINVKYGFSIPEVCWNLQENISKVFKNSSDVKLDKINIHIENVDFNKGS